MMKLDGLSLSLKLSLEPRKKISECVLACAGVRKRWKCAVVDGVQFNCAGGSSTMGLCTMLTTHRTNNEVFIQPTKKVLT